MKKFTSVLLTLLMLFSMFTSVSARTIADSTAYVPNPMELGLEVGVKAKSGSGSYQPNSLLLTDVDTSGKVVDYIATLNMNPIRLLFDEGFMQTTFLTDNQIREEFNAARVSTTVNVIIDYPSTVIIPSDVDLTSSGVGSLDAGSIFSEAARTLVGNKLTITYVNNNNLTAQELMANKETYLKDISFSLLGTASYAEAGSHKLSITLEGETTVKFATKEQVVKYHGQASHIVNVERGNAIEHVLDVQPAKPATCTEAGHTEGIICSTCNSYTCGAEGVVTPTVILPLNHKDASGASLKHLVEGVAPTCVQDGVTAHYTCSLCKANFDTMASDVIKPHEAYIIPHTNVHRNSVEEVIPATCGAPGHKNGTHCLDCGTVTKAPSIDYNLPAHANIVNIKTAKPATCTEEGHTAGKKCDDCNTVIEPSIKIAKLDHDFGEWVITPATPVVEGSKVRTCINCSETETIVIPTSSHTIHVIDSSKDIIVSSPTCTEAGSKQQFCSCGTAMGTAVIPATGHNLSHIAGVTATCISKGKAEHYHCNLCNKNYREAEAKNVLNSIDISKDKSNHVSVETLVGYAATCKKAGLSDGKICRACNTVTVKQEKTNKLTTHELVPITATAPTCTTDGVEEHKHCSVCDKDFNMAGTVELKAKDMVIPATGHSYGDPVKNIPEDLIDNKFYKASKTCSVCSAVADAYIVKEGTTCLHEITTVDGAGIEHKTSALVTKITKAPTCYAKGVGNKMCSLCGWEDSATIEIAMTEHATYEWVPGVAPTCAKMGYEGYYKCPDCDKIFDSKKHEISTPRVLDKITEHSFEMVNKNMQRCHICGEKVSVKPKDTNGNDSDIGVELVRPDHVNQTEAELEAEETIKEKPSVVSVETHIEVAKKAETSKEIEEKIQENKTTEDTTVKKLVFDIGVEKAIFYENVAVPVVIPYKETEGLVGIKISLASLSDIDKAKSIIVYRHHNDGVTDYWDEIRESNDITKERIEVAADRSYVTLYVKKFSEYAIAAYSTEVPFKDTTLPGGGSTASIFSIKFNSNGGSPIDTMTIKRGDTAVLPTPVREGYVFAGWFIDPSFTVQFDVTTPINKDYNLYAKWIQAHECDGTEEMNCPCLDFYDLDPAMWYHVGVDYVLNNGMMIGVAKTQFAPDWNVTRAMLVTMLYRAEGKPDVSARATFADIETGEYYETPVDWAYENNIVNGYSDTVFAPHDSLTREQIAAIIYRYASFKGYDVSVGENTNILSYTDASEISEYAIPAMQYTAGTGLITGRTESTLNPKAATTRAEIATIMYRFFTNIK